MNQSAIKAFELKLAQGAKTRGGHMEGNKVTEEIAQIRNVKPFQTLIHQTVLTLFQMQQN